MTQSAVIPSTLSLAERFAGILQVVMACVATRIHRRPTDCWGVFIPAPVENLINGWIMRRRNLILALLARIKAGTQRTPRAYQPRGATSDAMPVSRSVPVRRLPRALAWLCALAQETRIQGVDLGRLVNETEMKTAVMAHPQLARLIRPLLRMLGERDPDWLPPSPTRVRRQGRTATRRAPRAAPQPRPDDPSVALARLHAASVARQREAWEFATKIRKPGDREPARWAAPPAKPPPGAAALTAPPPPFIPPDQEWWRKRYRIILASRPAGI